MKTMRAHKSENYNWVFNTVNGSFCRWGKTTKDDPKFSPIGPEILDLEISTICHGIKNVPCSHCYKSNTGTGKVMSFETFKIIFDKMPKNLTQIAFGIGDIDANPDMWRMFKYSRENGVIPNVTINGDRMTPEEYHALVHYCGAVAVSRYAQYDVCYDAVDELTKLGLKQVNIHQLLCRETYDSCFKLIDELTTDDRLSKLYAVVFLMMKPKGDRNKMTSVGNMDDYKKLIDYAFSKSARIGFDSCFAPTFLSCVKDHKDFNKFVEMAEPCESSLFSSYINVDGRYVHCSFTEGEDGWHGVDVVGCDDFMKDVWYGEETMKFRELLTSQNHDDIAPGCRKCPVFELF